MFPVTKKKNPNKRPWWSIIILLILSIINLQTASWAYQNSVDLPIDGLPTFATFAIFGQANGLLVAGVIYFFYRGAQAYDNKGMAIDRSHIWVNAETGKKVSDASIRTVYEKQHGYGSWEKKVQKERGCVTVFALIIAVILTVVGFSYLSFTAQLPLLTSVQALLGSNLLYWVSWVLLAILGCCAIFMLHFVFWDLAQYNTSLAFSPTGHLLRFKNDPPSLFIILPKVITLFLAVLLNIGILIFVFLPSLRTAPIGVYFSFLLSLTFLTSGILWIFGVILQDHKVNKEFNQRESPEEKKTRLESAVQTLFGKDSDEKERLIAAFVLLNERDNLTLDGKKSLVDVLTAVSGENFGTDYPKWEEWIMKQLMK
jgi:hypothetical protein